MDSTKGIQDRLAQRDTAPTFRPRYVVQGFSPAFLAMDSTNTENAGAGLKRRAAKYTLGFPKFRVSTGNAGGLFVMNDAINLEFCYNDHHMSVF
jgi:hypothetical protein